MKSALLTTESVEAGAGVFRPLGQTAASVLLFFMIVRAEPNPGTLSFFHSTSNNHK